MSRPILSLILVLIATPAFGATEPTPAPRIATEAPATAPTPRPTMHLEQISVEERSADENEAAAVQLGPRGGFWWMVGVIVVAVVILAVLL